MVQHHLATAYMLVIVLLVKIEAENIKWKEVCKLKSGGGGIQVSGDIKQIFDDGDVPVIVVENKNSDVSVKCVNNKGNAKIYDDNDNVLKENHPETSSVEHLLWKKNFTTFWKSEKIIKCMHVDGCSVKFIEIKDGTYFKSNCTESEDEKGLVWCHVKDWVDNALVSRGGHEMDCNQTGEYDNEAHYKFSFFNQETKEWRTCGEYDQQQKKAMQDTNVSFMKCNISGVASWGKDSLLVKMEKIHESKTSAGLSFLRKKPDCQESTYFMIEDKAKPKSEQHLSKGYQAFIGLVVSMVILIAIGCALKQFQGKRSKYDTGRQQLSGLTNPDREAGYVEQELIGSTPSSSTHSGKNSTARLSSIEDVEECLPNISYKLSSNFDRQCSIRLEASKKAELDTSTEEDKKWMMNSNILDGDSSKVNHNLPLTEQTRILHYDRRYERSKDSFVIGHIIGEGQFGTVFVGTAKNIYGPTDTKVAVKQVKDMRDENQINTIIDELKILSNLEMHLNLVNLLAACTSELVKNEMYLLLEYCPFGDMKKFLVERRDKFLASLQNRPGHLESPFNASLLYSWSYSIAQGLEYLQSKRIMHGDLAARNILVGENFVAKISDFGLSKMMYYNQDYKKTKRRFIPWAWMATEYLQTGEFNLKSDVWSYGVTLWEIFSLGNKPYGFEPYEETKIKILDGHRLPCPEPLEYIDGGTSVYDDVMMKCWKADFKDRPNFKEISDKLEALLGEKGVDEYHQQVYQYTQKQKLFRSTTTLPEDSNTAVSTDPPGDGYIRVESLPQQTPMGALQPPVGAYVQLANTPGSTGYIGLQDVKHS